MFLKTEKIPVFSKKLPGSIWGITTFFNPADYVNKLENYKKFRRSLKQQGLKLLTIELAFFNKEFKLTKNDADILIQVRGDEKNIIWQKEALLNLGIKKLPDGCDKIVWLDCDIIFENDNWIKETSESLEKYKIIQPFSWSFRLVKNNKRKSFKETKLGEKNGERLYGVVYGALTKGKNVLHWGYYEDHGHTGFAWAARKEIFDKIGFYDRALLYSGDLLMAMGFYGVKAFHMRMNENLYNDYAIWADKIEKNIAGSISCTPGNVLHLWHGSFSNKCYHHGYYDILVKNNFDPRKDIKKNEKGILEWSSGKPRLHKCVREYFFIRREEGFKFNLKTSFYLLKGLLSNFHLGIFDLIDSKIGLLGKFLQKKLPKLYYNLKNLQKKD